MSRAASKMKCPNCGEEMNHHADKIVYGVGSPVEPVSTFEVGGVIEEFHACPACGSAASRLGTSDN
jgi:predicted RNA-binding Zn-ribbon protein involved in translation (DUF1610 family)